MKKKGSHASHNSPQNGGKLKETLHGMPTQARTTKQLETVNILTQGSVRIGEWASVTLPGTHAGFIHEHMGSDNRESQGK